MKEDTSSFSATVNYILRLIRTVRHRYINVTAVPRIKADGKAKVAMTVDLVLFELIAFFEEDFFLFI